MNFVFRVIYLTLKLISSAIGLTYNEINIVVYYFLIPFVLLFLVDRIIKKYILSPALIVCWIFLLLSIPNFSRFCDRLFDASVVFLNGFSVIGWNYIVASVVICVIVPALVFAVAFYFAFPKLLRRRSETL